MVTNNNFDMKINSTLRYTWQLKFFWHKIVPPSSAVTSKCSPGAHEYLMSLKQQVSKELLINIAPSPLPRAQWTSICNVRTSCRIVHKIFMPSCQRWIIYVSCSSGSHFSAAFVTARPYPEYTNCFLMSMLCPDFALQKIQNHYVNHPNSSCAVKQRGGSSQVVVWRLNNSHPKLHPKTQLVFYEWEGKCVRQIHWWGKLHLRPRAVGGSAVERRSQAYNKWLWVIPLAFQRARQLNTSQHL